MIIKYIGLPIFQIDNIIYPMRISTQINFATGLSTYLFLLFLTLSAPLQAQTQSDSTRKNTIKLDLTSYWLYRNAIVFSYERTVKPTQTYMITAGIQQFPSLGALDSINVTRNTSASGYKFGGEYRFYLKKENKYHAPRGVFIGPYTTFLNFSNKRALEIDNNGVIEHADFTTKLNVINIGVELGYQFVLNNRWTLDFIFVGPSISYYNAKMTLDGNFTFDPEELENNFVNALMDRFPGLEDLVNEENVTSKGRISSWGYGYRFQFHAGYHFGRKKNKN
jgi:hypothetical protein